jgi:hypothetical protein
MVSLYSPSKRVPFNIDILISVLSRVVATSSDALRMVSKRLTADGKDTRLCCRKDVFGRQRNSAQTWRSEVEAKTVVVRNATTQNTGEEESRTRYQKLPAC